METTKIAVKIEEKNAVLAGSKVYGWVVIEYDPATLTEKQRETITMLEHTYDPDKKQAVSVIYSGNLWNLGTVSLGIVAESDLPVMLDAWRDKRDAADAAKKAEAAKIKAETDEKISAWLTACAEVTDPEMWVKHSNGWTVNFPVSKPYLSIATNYGSYSEHELLDKYPAALAMPATRIAVQTLRAQAKELCYKKAAHWAEIVKQQNAENKAKEALEDAEAASKEERKQAQLSAWVQGHMTETQQKRRAISLMDDSEIINSIRDHVFASLNDEIRYEKITASEVRDAADLDYYEAGTVEFYVPDAESITDEQFERMELLKSKIPGSTAEVKKHAGYITGIDNDEDRVTRLSVLITVTVGELKLSREYAL